MKQITFLTIYLLFLSCKNEVLGYEIMNVTITPRVVGGQNADPILHSYTLQLRNHGNFLCTAFAVTQQDIFSAAHCFEDLNPPYPDVTVHSAAANTYVLGTVHAIEKITIHPDFSGNWKTALLHDLAHILLDERSRLTIDANQRKVDLPEHDVHSQITAIMTGWGCTIPYGNAPAEQLQKLQMQVVNYMDCQDRMKKKLRRFHLCAFVNAGHGCATGDSGGPLVRNNVAIGLHSWCHQNKCAEGEPEIFTNLYQERGFIQSVMQRQVVEISSDSSSSSDTPEFMGKKPRKESSNSKKKGGWLRKIMCTSP